MMTMGSEGRAPRVGVAVHEYSESSGFEPRPKSRLFWLSIFLLFLQSLYENTEIP
jgi:hypothetical protein